MKSKYLKYGIILLLIILVLPLFIDLCIFGNSFPSNLKNSEWAGFLGSYIGALIGSIVTLLGIGITLKFTREEATRDREFQQQQTNEDRRLSLAPYLKYTMCKKTLLKEKHDIDIFYIIDDNENTFVNATIELKNIGMGALLDLKVYDITFKNIEIKYELNSVYEILEKGSQWLMLIDLRLRLDEIKDESIIENKEVPIGSLYRYSPPPEYKNKGGNLSFKIQYKDLIGNQYEQDIEIYMSISLEGSDGGTKWKYSEPTLSIHKVGKSKVIK